MSGIFVTSRYRFGPGYGSCGDPFPLAPTVGGQGTDSATRKIPRCRKPKDPFPTDITSTRCVVTRYDHDTMCWCCLLIPRALRGVQTEIRTISLESKSVAGFAGVQAFIQHGEC